MRRAIAVALLTVGVALSLAPADEVLAHASLEASVPAASSVLEESPDQIVLDFDEPIEAAGASIELFDASAAAIEIGEPRLSTGDGSVLVADAPELDEGLYAVVWRIASSDGHVVSGSFSFQIGSAAAGDAGALLDRVGDRGTNDAVTRSLGVARFVAYLGAAIVLGGGLLLLAHPSPRRRAMWLLRGGAIAAVVGTVAAFGLYAASVSGGGVGDAVDPSAWGTATDTRAGHMLVVRMVAVVALGLLVATWASASRSWWRATALVASVALVIATPAGGHPGAESRAAVAIANGALHTGGALVWIGGLIVLVAIGGREPVRRFSIISSFTIPVVVLTGVAQTLDLVDDLDDVTGTSWGRVLLVKVCVVALVLAIAGVSRWLVLHSRDEAAAARSLRRTVATEALLGVGILGLVAGLVALPPTSAPESQVFTTTLSQAGVIVDVTVTPGGVGANEIHVILTPPGGSIEPVVSLEARMQLPSRGVPATPVEIETLGPNHYTGRITLPFEGDWTLDLIVEVTAGSTVLLTTTVPI